MKYDVFISYSRRDYSYEDGAVIPGNIVSKIKDFLTENGYTYWFDEEGIYSGDAFVGVITEAIENSEIFLFISTESSNRSPWTSKEIATANFLEKKIIPFKVDKTLYDRSVLMYLAPLDYIDYANKPTKAFSAFLSAINNHFEKINKIVKREDVPFLIDEDDKNIRLTPLFFLVDVSGSMHGQKMEILNNEMQAVIPQLKRLSAMNSERIILANVISFGSEVECMYEYPIDIKNFQWVSLNAQGLTSFGAALNLLDNHLCVKKLMYQHGNYIICPSVIILISDGEPTDNYKTALHEIKKNKWFRYAKRLCIAIGDDFDSDYMNDFAGNDYSIEYLSLDNLSTIGLIVKTMCREAFNIGSSCINKPDYDNFVEDKSNNYSEEFDKLLDDFLKSN